MLSLATIKNGKFGPMLIILSLLDSDMNCRKAGIKPAVSVVKVLYRIRCEHL